MSVSNESVLQRAATAPSSNDLTRAGSKPHGRVRVFRNWCKGCGLCVAFCPQQVFATDEHQQPLVVHPERCVVCHWCTMHCPDFAIVVELVDPRNEAAK